MVRLLFTLALLVRLLPGQLHLISGTPTREDASGFAVDLYAVRPGGSLRQIAELVPRQVGADWIGISYDLRKAIILAKGGDPPLVLNLDQAAVSKRCASPSPEVCRGLSGSLYQWLADVPGRGASFEWYVGDQRPGAGSVHAMAVDSSVPCDKSFATVSPSDIQYIVAHGSAGVGADVNRETDNATMNADGKLRVWLADTEVFFGYTLPAELRKGIPFGWAAIVVNNAQAMVAGIVKDAESAPSFACFRKRDQTWHALPTLNVLQWCLRGFDHYVAITETLRQSSGPESAGRSEWRTRNWRLGPDMEESFRTAGVAYPGRLHLFDIDTEKIFTINTKQADSEVLLIEDGTVYYRVIDRLYSAPITAKGIGTAQMVVQGEPIRAVHWAFIAHNP